MTAARHEQGGTGVAAAGSCVGDHLWFMLLIAGNIVGLPST
jgi:hypothetical protein